MKRYNTSTIHLRQGFGVFNCFNCFYSFILFYFNIYVYCLQVANHVEVTNVVKDGSGRVVGLRLRDAISGRDLGESYARVVVNATGPYSDALR